MTSLRDFIRAVLELDPIPASLAIPKQGPLRSLGSRDKAGSAAGGSGGGRGGNADGGGGGGGGGGMGGSLPAEHGARHPATEDIDDADGH